MSFDFANWTDEEDKQAAKMRHELNIFTDFKKRSVYKDWYKHWKKRERKRGKRRRR